MNIRSIRVYRHVLFAVFVFALEDRKSMNYTSNNCVFGRKCAMPVSLDLYSLIIPCNV